MLQKKKELRKKQQNNHFPIDIQKKPIWASFLSPKLLLTFKIANNLSKEEAKGRLSGAISNVIIEFGDESSFDFVVSSFTKMPLSQEKFTAIASLVNLLEKVKTKANFEKGVDEIVKFRDLMPEQIRVQTTPYINNMILKGLADKKDAAGDKVFADYVRGKISK